ncbi:PLP-dependent aminotransferase family protein [Acidisoma cellulosilytica]|uniref:PLP-dependent aminotransferase family protein n=1 Tax=Acidisoma cellulosilyticum TaxID=2802395 RepID=A0A964E5E9_9PROT|nr:PLP-dependent aminotransferase family protein [Acidisoma cellulosilyticum]MCB8882347.1 PLP-dependent aminotransferase family protein [Acidisoma cellulosilyticum]
MNNSSHRVTQYLRDMALAAMPGTRLPSVRALMRDLGVSPVTVQRAIDTLVQAGLIEALPGQGTFVRERRRETESAATPDFGWQSLALGSPRTRSDGLNALLRMPKPDVMALNLGYLPEESLPQALLSAAGGRALRRPGVWARVPIEGLEALRAWFATETGDAYAASEVTICPGTQAANAAAFRALAQPGDPVIVESPTYTGAIAAATSAGLRLVPVPMDEDGVRPDLLEQAFARTGARLFYCQPTFSNPTGAVLSTARRQAVLDIVTRAGAFLIEDDWARDFSLEGEPPPPLASADRDGHVVYIRSLTKCAAPGLRIGAICARGAALERLRMARLTDDFSVPGLMQETALQLVTAPSWPKHLKALRAELKRRRDLLVAAVHTELGDAALAHVPAGGLHLWVALPPGRSDTDIARRAAAEDVLVGSGRFWFPAEATGPYLRLSFAGAKPDWIGEAVRRLGRIIATETAPAA